MNDWMNCNTCRRSVRVNPTGVCLACQSGFSGEICEDDFLWEAIEYQKTKERIDAIEERIKQIDSKEKHQGDEEGGLSTEASYSSFPPNCS